MEIANFIGLGSAIAFVVAAWNNEVLEVTVLDLVSLAVILAAGYTLGWAAFGFVVAFGVASFWDVDLIDWLDQRVIWRRS